VFPNRVLRKILGSKRNEVPGDSMRLHNEQLYEMCYSPNIAQLIKSRMRWEMHLAHMEGEMHTGIWWGNEKERDHLEDLGTDGRILQ